MTRLMQAMVATGEGGPEVLERREVDLPWPAGPRDVLVRLKAAGLNPADVWFRKLGPYVRSPGPLILGHDGAGVVEEAGPRVARVKAGDAVAFCWGGIGAAPGTYAEFAVVPEALLAAKPAAVGFAEAAALPLAAITMAEALQERARVKRGEHVLIHAGAGGTGHLGIQYARLAGAHVATTVSGEAKARLAESLGAQLAIPYRDRDFVAAAREWTRGRGLDVALDNVGAEVLTRTFAAMAPYGRVVTLMGLAPDSEAGDAYNGNLTLHSVMMLTPMWRALKGRLARQAAHVRRALALLAEGRLRVAVDRSYPLADAAEAHRRLESGQALGKIVLTM